MIRRRACSQRFLVSLLLPMAFSSSSTVPLPRPMPAKRCTVVPPMATAARPVEAVMKVPESWLNAQHTYCNKKDLPEPAQPVKKTDLRSMIASSTCFCSSESVRPRGAGSTTSVAISSSTFATRWRLLAAVVDALTSVEPLLVAFSSSFSSAFTASDMSTTAFFFPIYFFRETKKMQRTKKKRSFA